jgi:hypothetical protein
MPEAIDLSGDGGAIKEILKVSEDSKKSMKILLF